MLKIREAVIVEGRYDKIKLSSIVDAPIIETNGFRVFSDKEKQSLIRKIADTRGILIMTDSDGAGFVIRNFLKGSVDNSKIKNCYIPQIKGKEKRKAKGGKEGLLGVEGVSDEVIINAIRKSGAEIIGEENNIPEDKSIVTLIGRLTNWKGQKLLIEALHLLKDEDFFCVMIGDDQGRKKYSAELRKMIAEYDMTDRFLFIRNVKDVPAAMMVSDVVLSTSIEPEAFGRIAIEGQSMGRVVVASNIGGSVETVIDGVTGRLYESSSAEDLAAAIKWALHLSTEEREKIGAAGIKNVKEHFTKQIMCDKTIEVYKELINL